MAVRAMIRAGRLGRGGGGALCMLILAGAAFAADRTAQDRLVAAYPAFLIPSTKPNIVLWKDGTEMVFDDGVRKANFTERAANASLWDQMDQPYPAGWPAAEPGRDQDPGRLRHEPFFRKMYGQTAKDVESQLVPVPWPPGGKRATISFAKTNGAADALAAVGLEIVALPPDVKGLVARTQGSFNWRAIAGARQLSMHSFGIAVDFEFPKALQHYWRWKNSDPDAAHPYPAGVLQDARLGRIVQIFEKHGFIWGGKWYHFDTIHFEFRPELVGANP